MTKFSKEAEELAERYLSGEENNPEALFLLVSSTLERTLRDYCLLAEAFGWAESVERLVLYADVTRHKPHIEGLLHWANHHAKNRGTGGGLDEAVDAAKEHLSILSRLSRAGD